MTFLLTLFLSFAKRRDDVLRMNETGEPPRKNTIRYNLTFINQAITITASVTLVCYIMYTVSPEVVNRFHSDLLYLTSVFVLLGLLRYIQITVVRQEERRPYKDDAPRQVHAVRGAAMGAYVPCADICNKVRTIADLSV